MSSEVPIACSLSAGEMVERRAAWDALVRSDVVAVSDVPGGVRVELRPGMQVESRARELVALEEACCPFLSFAFSSGDGADAGQVLTVKAPAAAVPLARGLFAAASGGRYTGTSSPS